MKEGDTSNADLAHHVQGMRGELKKMRQELSRLSRLERNTLVDHPGRLLGVQFTLGIVRGFGGVVGATLLVAVTAYILSHVPIVRQLVQGILSIGAAQ